MLHRNAEGVEQLGLTDAGQFQDVRRLDGSGGDDDFLVAAGFLGDAVLCVSDADGAFAVEHDFRGVGVGFDAQIRTGADRIEKAARGGPAFAVLLRDLIIAEAFLAAVVVIFVAGETFGAGGVDEGVQKFGFLDHVGDMQRAIGAAGISPPGSKRSAFLKYGNTDS